MTTRLTQTIPEVGGPIPGDCWRTAVACLLDLDDPTDVPHFIAEDQARGDDTSTRWWSDTVAFVEGRLAPGGTLLLVEPTFPVYIDPDEGRPHVIATGPSPRGDFLHAVIVDARTGVLVWDPHPDRTGLGGDPVDVAAIACPR